MYELPRVLIKRVPPSRRAAMGPNHRPKAGQLGASVWQILNPDLLLALVEQHQ